MLNSNNLHEALALSAPQQSSTAPKVQHTVHSSRLQDNLSPSACRGSGLARNFINVYPDPTQPLLHPHTSGQTGSQPSCLAATHQLALCMSQRHSWHSQPLHVALPAFPPPRRYLDFTTGHLKEVCNCHDWLLHYTPCVSLSLLHSTADPLHVALALQVP